MHRSWRGWLTAAGAAAALAACQPGSNSAGGAAPAERVRVEDANVPPEQLGASLDPASAPHPRAGYWRERVATDGAAPVERRVCATGGGRAPPAATCPVMRLQRTRRGGVQIFSICRNGGAEIQTTQHVEGDFTTWYSSQTRSEGSIGSTRIVQHIHTEADYVGPCPTR